MKKKQNQTMEIDALKQQIQELDNKWKRALADYQNLEKRALNERQFFIKLANAGLLTKILPIIDDLERAALHLKDQGLDLVLKRLGQLLKEEGVKEINPINEAFNPTQMECVDKEAGEENKVIRVDQKGYAIGESVIRPAKVIVGIKNTNL